MANGSLVFRQIRKLAQGPCTLSDRALLQQFLADADEAAFAALVQRHGAMVLGLCRSVLRHQQDAEDVFQATFLVLARKAHTIRKHEALGSWLHGVAYRLALKAKTQANRRHERASAADAGSAASAIDDLTVGELRLILHEEMHALPEQYRGALLLCYWEGKTRDEAAEQLGVTSDAFKKTLERARNLLGSKLVRRGLAPSATLFTLIFTSHAANAASSPLIQNTAQAAAAFATGKSTAAATTAALALAEGVIRTMFITQCTKWIVIVLSVIAFGIAGLAGYSALDAQPPATPRAIGPPQVKKVPPKVQPKKTEVERIVGVWRVTSAVGNGEEAPADFRALGRFVFAKDGKLTMLIANEGRDGTYKIVEPGKIDMTMMPSEHVGAGIYKFDGDNELTLCFTDDETSKKRPTEYSGAKDTRQMLLTLERAKPGQEKVTPEEIAKHRPELDKIKEAAAIKFSQNNLKQIGLAFHQYHDIHNAFPAHAIYDKKGEKPLLSWRVAILPFLDQEELYKEFKLDEPWDSAHNKKLIDKMPRVFTMQNVGRQGKGLTYYQVFTGPDTLFNGAKALALTDISDGTANTLLAIEGKDPVIWTKPDDLQLPKDKDKLPAIGGLFKDGINTLYCDGSVRSLPRDVGPALLRAIVTPAGNEVIDP